MIIIVLTRDIGVRNHGIIGMEIIFIREVKNIGVLTRKILIRIHIE
jgi:hypothetical protein